MGLDQGINNLAGANALFVYKWEVIDGNGIPLGRPPMAARRPSNHLDAKLPHRHNGLPEYAGRKTDLSWLLYCETIL